VIHERLKDQTELLDGKPCVIC